MEFGHAAKCLFQVLFLAMLAPCATLTTSRSPTTSGFSSTRRQIRALIDETQRLTARDSRRRRARRGAAAGVRGAARRRRLAARQLRHARRHEQDGRRHRPVRALPRRGQVALSVLARRAGRRRDAGARSPRVGTGRHLSRPAGRDGLPAAGRRPRSGARGSRGREAPGARPRRVLHAAAADRRHPLRQHDLRHAVDLDSPARQRHRVRLATQVRAGHRRRHAVPLRLRQRAVSAGSP